MKSIKYFLMHFEKKNLGDVKTTILAVGMPPCEKAGVSPKK